jgi:hypothetical protein
MLGIPKSTLAQRMKAIGSPQDPQQSGSIPNTTVAQRRRTMGLSPGPESIPDTAGEQHKRAMGLSHDPERPESIHSVHISTPGIQDVHTGIPEDMSEDFHELVAWWRERKALLHDTAEGARQTERATFHVEKRWIEAIRRLADLERLTYTQIINKAFQQFFTQKST